MNDKSVVRFNFDEEDQAWSVVLPNGENYEFMTFIDENHVSMPGIDGTRQTVELSADGLLAYKMMASETLWALNK